MQASTLQATKADGKMQFTWVIVNWAESAIGQHVLACVQFLYQIRRCHGGVSLQDYGAFVLQLLPVLNA